MNTRAISVNADPVAGTQAARSVYVFMAVLFIVVAVTGFSPRSLAIVAGERPMPVLIVHLHAATMSAWLVLLLAQTLLMSSGRAATHRSLGMISMFLGPAMFIFMSALVIRGFLGIVQAQAVMPPQQLGNTVAFQTFIMARAALLFGVFFAWAVAVRKTSPETHKRMMIMATFMVIDAAIARVPWLPGAYLRDGGVPVSVFVGYDLTHIYQLLLLVPVFFHEIVRNGRVHWAYLLGTGLFLFSAISAHFAWNSPAWARMVAGIVGG